MPQLNLYGLSVEELSEVLRPLDARSFTARQIAAQIYGRGVRDFARMTDLPASIRQSLAERFSILLPEPARILESEDGTVRYVLSLPAGGSVEAVMIPDRGRVTLCLSSQAGCALGCTFCMTATLGLERNLSPGDIAGQAALLMERHHLEVNTFNIVLMGMGEPLHNYDSVVAALRLLTDTPAGFGLSPRRVTISTAGLAPQIEALGREPVVPRLAVSLNATTDESRSRLMPINRRYPIARLMEACRAFLSRRGSRLTLEYVMLSGVNDAPSDLQRLARLALSLPARVNLIPFNTTPELAFQPSPAEIVHDFREGLVERGVMASIRRSRGRDIRAACGQLAFGMSGEGDATRRAGSVHPEGGVFS